MLRGKGYYLSSALCFAFIMASFAIAADFWTKKPYQSWSADETRRLLEESPWAATVTVNGIRNDIVGLAGVQGTGKGAEMETNPSIAYTVRFFSARPIREAQVRSSQLGSRYDGMNADKKAAFDANAAKFLGVSFADRVIVSVSFQTEIENYRSFLRNYWASQSVSKLSMTTYLNAGSERLSLLAFNAQGETFMLTFPRPKRLSQDDKMGIEFVSPRISVIGEQRILQEFSVRKMMLDGQPVY